MSASPPVTALILAGGRGRRMGGQDKGLLEVGGRALIETILQAIAPQVSAILINANRNQTRYRRYGYPVLADALPNFQGPLAGFAVGLRHCATDELAILPCDSPFVPHDLVARLRQARQREQAEIAVVHDGARLQPVHALLHKGALPSLDAFLETGDRKIERWYGQQRIALADFSAYAPGFVNLNRPEDGRRLAGASL